MNKKNFNLVFIILIAAFFITRLISPEIIGNIHLFYNTSWIEKILFLIISIFAFLSFKKIKDKKEVFSQKFFNIAFLVILAIGLTARFHKLDLSLIHDEAFQMQAVKGILKTGLPKYPSGLLYPRGLTYSYLSAFVSFINNQTVTETTCRIVSIFFYFLTTILLFSVAKNIFNKRVALISHLVFSFSFFSIAISRFARMYISVTFFIFAAISSFYFIYFKKDKRWFKVFWSSMFLAMISHNVSLLLFFTLIPLSFFIAPQKKVLKNNLPVLAILLLFALIAFFTSSGYGAFIGFFKLIPSFINLKPNFYFLAFYPLVFPFISLITILGFIYNIKTSKTKFWLDKRNFFFFPCVIYVLAITFTNFKMNQRYLFLIFPIIILLFAYALDKLILFFAQELKINYKYFFLASFLTITVYFGKDLTWIAKINYGSKLPRYKGVSSHVYIYPDYKTTSLYVKNHYQDKDIVVSLADNNMQHSFYFENINYWLSKYSETEPKVIKNQVQNTTIQELKHIIKNKKTRVWLITSYDSAETSLNFLHYSFINQKTIDFLKKSQNKIIYHGKDNISKVYLFE
jgi:hypothetical protein